MLNVPTAIICGLTDDTTGIGLSNVNVLVPWTPASLLSAASTDTTLLAGLAGRLAGAVYWPVELITPTVELPPVIPFTDHVSAVCDVPVTVAVNCNAGSPGRTLAISGLSATPGC